MKRLKKIVKNLGMEINTAGIETRKLSNTCVSIRAAFLMSLEYTPGMLPSNPRLWYNNICLISVMYLTIERVRVNGKGNERDDCRDQVSCLRLSGL
jgi:hypothetical protein